MPPQHHLCSVTAGYPVYIVCAVYIATYMQSRCLAAAPWTVLESFTA